MGFEIEARRCSGRLAAGALEVVEDLADDGWLGEELEDPHRSPKGTRQGVGFVDPADEHGGIEFRPLRKAGSV